MHSSTAACAVGLVMLLCQAAVPKLLLAGSLCGTKGWQQYAESTLSMQDSPKYQLALLRDLPHSTAAVCAAADAALGTQGVHAQHLCSR